MKNRHPGIGQIYKEPFGRGFSIPRENISTQKRSRIFCYVLQKYLATFRIFFRYSIS